MTPEQHAIYHTTYAAALNMLLGRCSDACDAVQQAAKFAKLAVDLYPVTTNTRVVPVIGSYTPEEPAKRGPGRPPKESK